MAFSDLFWKLFIPTAIIAALAVLIVVTSLAIAHHAPVPRMRRRGTPIHVLVVLGSGGHTTEMFYILEKAYEQKDCTYRTYVVTSGDKFSAKKAVDFEAEYSKSLKESGHADIGEYDVITIPRARRVHQSYWTAPFSTLQCFWACLLVLLGRHPGQKQLPSQYLSVYPDLIFSNGPAVAVCMVSAAKAIRFCIFIYRWITLQGHIPTMPKLRTIYIESWARISKLSTSGILLLPLADKFLVQWPDIAGLRAWWGMKKTEYAGWLVL
ncbi:hypothetical protein N7470_005643 [Penicillium chermesinum]|nr:hypothetical protein N7470_005643 [Penicillium chermesinum]